MLISDSAKELMLKVLEEDQKNVIKIDILRSGCHGQLYLDTIISNDFELINDVPVQISNVDREYLDNISFDVKNGNLVYTLANSSGCSGCSGCSDECSGCN